MVYQSCGSVGDRYDEEYAAELMTDDDEINLSEYQYYQLEDYYFDWQVEWALAQEELCKINTPLTETTGQVESDLWAGAERVVLEL